MMTETSFHAASTMLQSPSPTRMNPSFTEQEDSGMFYHTSQTTSSSSVYNIHQLIDEEEDEDMMIPVPQHLDSEQIKYEFPPRSHLKALAYLDQLEQEYSYFDETSFTTLSSSNDSSSGYFDEHREEDDSLSIMTPSPPLVSTRNSHPDRNQQYHHHYTSLIDGNKNDLDLTRLHHHMLNINNNNNNHSSSSSSRHQHLWRQMNDYHHEIQGRSPSTSPPPSFTTNITQQFQQHPPLIEDHRLSPLQLPSQLYHQPQHSLKREESYDSTSTITKNAIVAPHSYLTLSPSINNNYSTSYHVTQIDTNSLPPRHSSLDSLVDLPIIISETSPILEQQQQEYHDDFDRDSMTSDDLYPQQQVVLIKISKQPKTKQQQQQDRSPTSLTHLSSDEGYVDEDRDGKRLVNLGEIESASVFLPVAQEQSNNTPSRPSCIPSSSSNYRSVTSSMDDNTTQWGLRATWTRFYQEQAEWANRIEDLERQLKEERAMRLAFEKAMEDMTVVIDQQQKVVYDRLEQEIRMRQAYEHKMQQILAHVEPLEAQLEKETASRIQLEEAMVHVLDQLDILHAQHQQHVKDDALERSRMQTTLDKALYDINNKLTTGDATQSSSRTTTKASSIIVDHHYRRASKVSASNVTNSSSKTNIVSKPAARPNALSVVKSTASGITANTIMPHNNKSRITSTLVKSTRTTTTTNNYPKSTTTPSAPMSKKNKFPNNNNITKTNNNRRSTTPTKTLLSSTSSR